MAASSKVLPVDSAVKDVETTLSKTPNSTPAADVSAAPAPRRPRTWAFLAIIIFAYIYIGGAVVSLFGLIISALCGWDRLAQGIEIYIQLQLLFFVVGAFLVHFLALFEQHLYYSRRRVLIHFFTAIMCIIYGYSLLLDLAHDGINVKKSCAIVAAAYLLLLALAWYGNRHARSAAAAEATTNTPSEPKRKVIPVDDAAQLV